MIPILVKAQHEGRFLFCAALPLPDVDAAIREAVYALDTLHADGVKLGWNSVEIRVRGGVYGTDYPYVKAPILIRNLSALKNNLQEIAPQDVDQVLRGNAVKLFNK